VRDIAASSEQQSAASEQISHAIEDINGLSSRTSEAMDQSERSIQDLLRLFGELKALIGGMAAA
jgi:methyl-accepting chemotaxis protein